MSLWFPINTAMLIEVLFIHSIYYELLNVSFADNKAQEFNFLQCNIKKKKGGWKYTKYCMPSNLTFRMLIVMFASQQLLPRPLKHQHIVRWPHHQNQDGRTVRTKMAVPSELRWQYFQNQEWRNIRIMTNYPTFWTWLLHKSSITQSYYFSPDNADGHSQSDSAFFLQT